MDPMNSDEINLAERLQLIETQVRAITERNRRVEGDKAWEVSRTRVVFIVALTYLVTCLVFAVLAVPKFWLSAIIPTVGYYLSTRSLPIVKKWWLTKYYH